ncbi:hypothetical protein TI39_contig4202g00025 [Zymoseptoria brevis]|uniref:Uncharacterized protein n=1 Tax=Zymoseptoria brevis TaxID=1047168 RepID=A0A0F4GAD5_9PEZI|nr:hypothetical protein TI39_contig4202g00025 [Zymoseptoria brevis]
MSPSHCALLAEYDSRLTADHFLLTNREREMKALKQRIKVSAHLPSILSLPNSPPLTPRLNQANHFEHQTAEGLSMSEARSGEYTSLCKKRRELGREIGMLETKIKKVTAEMKCLGQKAKRARDAKQAGKLQEVVEGGMFGKMVGKVKVWLA